MRINRICLRHVLNASSSTIPSLTAMASTVSSTSGYAPKPKILVTDNSVWVPKLREVGEVRQNSEEGPMKRDVLLHEAADAEAIFCLIRDKIDKEFLDKAKKLKMIGTMSVGYEHINVQECKKRGIRIGYTPGVLTESTAELAIALLLTTSRRLPEAIQSAKSGGWSTWTPYYMCGKGLQNSTVGIYGMGTIGRSIAEKLVAFKPARILYTNRTKPQEANNQKNGVLASGGGGLEPVFVPFEQLLRESDFLIISASASAENYRVFNTKAFDQMKTDAILINVARGSLVNQQDLYKALKNGRIQAAGLDVTEPEPLPLDDPLFKLRNCVILPHIGSATNDTRTLMASTTEDNIYNFCIGKEMVYELRI